MNYADSGSDSGFRFRLRVCLRFTMLKKKKEKKKERGKKRGGKKGCRQQQAPFKQYITYIHVLVETCLMNFLILYHPAPLPLSSLPAGRGTMLQYT